MYMLQKIAKSALNPLLKYAVYWVLLFSPLSFGNDPFAPASDDFLPVEKAYRVTVLNNGENLTMEWSLTEGYYLYQHQFRAKAKTAEDSEALTLTFQPGLRKFDEYFGKELETYYQSTTVSAPLPKVSAPYELELTSQACADAGLCYPPRTQFFSVDSDGIILEVDNSQFSGSSSGNGSGLNPAGTAASSGTASSQPAGVGTVLFTILSAILGGLILNLMPCVFPVLSLKALSIASSQESPQTQQKHGWAYTAGVVGSFVVAALVIVIAREAGSSLGWGFQLQQPLFVALMAYLFFIMGLSLSGLFNLGGSLMGVGQNLTTGHGLRSSFFTGVLAALVASPCTAPFMATALGVAITQPAPIAVLIFAALGFGMALPFILLSYIPALANHLPAPGAWMETLKQFLAFPLYATTIWLLWVFNNQTSSNGAAMLSLGALLIVFGIWLWQRSPQGSVGKTLKNGLAITSLVLTAVLLMQASRFKSTATAAHSEVWQSYSTSALQSLRDEGKPVFIDLTADWCITCKVNESVALSSDKFFDGAKQLGFVLMKGDWTNADPEITELLAQHGRNGVPLYLVYPGAKHAKPEILPQILTTGLVLEAMTRATSP